MKIYLAAFPHDVGLGLVKGSTVGGDVLGVALCEDGTGLGEHVCSSVDFAKHDLGLTSEWKHDRYRQHAPAGYVLEWVADPQTHEGWLDAMVLNKARHNLRREEARVLERDWIQALDAMLEDRVRSEIAIEVRRLIAAYQQQQVVLATMETHMTEVYVTLGEALGRLKVLEASLGKRAKVTR